MRIIAHSQSEGSACLSIVASERCPSVPGHGVIQQLLHRAIYLLGGCYSDQGDCEAMNRHYQAALRLATDQGDDGAKESIRYNTVATQVQLGIYAKAHHEYMSMDAAYLKEVEYGTMLLNLYQDMQKELSNDYALFHQRWVEKWYVANRQFKQAYELKRKRLADRIPAKSNCCLPSPVSPFP